MGGNNRICTETQSRNTTGVGPDRHCKTGDKQNVTEYLCSDRCKKLLRRKGLQLIRTPGYNASDLPDLEQELSLEFIRQHGRYDQRRAREATFLSRVADNRSASLIRQQLTEKRDVRRNGISLNSLVSDNEGNKVERVSTFDESATLRQRQTSRRSENNLACLISDIHVVVQQLPLELRHLADLLQSTSEYDASRKLKKSRRQIANDISKIRQCFEDHGLREYL